MPDSIATLPTGPDFCRQPEIKMAAIIKPEIWYIIGLERCIREMPAATPTFTTMLITMQSANSARRQPTTGNQNGGRQTGNTVYALNFACNK